jgi:hypothetical protein
VTATLKGDLVREREWAFTMTAPVVQEQASDSRRYVVGFVMPADVSTEDIPDLVDSQVHTRRVPTETAAALRFSGRWSRSSSEKRTRNCSPP